MTIKVTTIIITNTVANHSKQCVKTTHARTPPGTYLCDRNSTELKLQGATSTRHMLLMLITAATV